MSKAGLLAIGGVILLGGCGAGGTTPGGAGTVATLRPSTPRAAATSPARPPGPGQMCQEALGKSGLLDWSGSTVARLRAFQYGGPAPIRPLAHAFPGVPGTTRGAWCATRPRAETTRWWAVTPGRAPVRAIDITGPGEGIRHGSVPRGPVVP